MRRLASAVIVAAVVCVSGCTTRSEPPATPGHPPYDARGGGTLSGELVRVVNREYPSGSLSEPVPYAVAVVRWDDGGTPRESEFLLTGVRRLEVEGKPVVSRYDEQSSDAVSETVHAMGPGWHIRVEYAGTDLLPVPGPPKSDYEYASATRVILTR